MFWLDCSCLQACDDGNLVQGDQLIMQQNKATTIQRCHELVRSHSRSTCLQVTAAIRTAPWRSCQLDWLDASLWVLGIMLSAWGTCASHQLLGGREKQAAQ